MALMGENGAGKSTLMKILVGVYQADSGEIFFDNAIRNFLNIKESQKVGIGIIHQELNLISELSISENIFLGREYLTCYGSIDWKKMNEQANFWLKKLGIEKNCCQKVSELSIAEQQLVEIAKVLSLGAKLIIMDEPTDALTERESTLLFTVIRSLREKGCGIIYISHRIDEIFSICDSVTVLRDGQFIDETAIENLNKDKLIENMVGQKIDDYYPYTPSIKGETLLQVNQLSAAGVENVSFSLNKGEIIGFSGLIGSGRTELMKIIYGATNKSAGEIRIKNRKLNIFSPSKAISQGIAYVSEDRKKDGIISILSVRDNMTLSILKKISIYPGIILKKKERKIVDDFINLFRIKVSSMNQSIGQLSGGNQQKVAIARALLTKPMVLILDEPTRGIDVGARKEIYHLINKLKEDGLSIILISSDMPEILGLSDRVLVMHEGEIKADFNRDSFSEVNIMAAAMGKNFIEKKI
jgi:ribose transport system ATP-binding protein